MAFEALSEKFQRIFKKLTGQATLSERNMSEMLDEIKIALLEADVNYKVVKTFLSDVESRAVGEKVIQEQLQEIPNPRTREVAGRHIADIEN